MPYGELLVYQTLTDYNERFKFTGKERDEETGYDYFGARNYTSAASIWLSVDPLADKYPGISPYAYCNWNPVKYIDPDGRDIILAGANKSNVTIRTDLINLNVDVSKLNVDFGGSYNFQGDEILGATLDIAGIFDPSGVADGLNAALQWNNGDVSGAVISATGLVPYLGDLAKVGKIKKDLGVINNAIQAANKSIKSNFSNSRKMTDNEIGEFFGDKNWHKGNYKKSLMKDFQKELKGSTNFDFYIDKSVNQVYIKGNKSEIWINTGEVL